MKFGERLRAAREHAKLSQGELAERTKLSQPTISYLENPAKNATGSEFTIRLARACGVSVDWLADEVGEMVPPQVGESDANPYRVEADDESILLRAFRMATPDMRRNLVRQARGILEDLENPSQLNGTEHRKPD